MKAKYALITEDCKFIIEEREVPEPGMGEVLIQIAGCGICGTDLNLFTGNQPKGWNIVYPFQMGHELSGIIHAVGDGVPDEPGLRVGDEVVPDGRLPCGYCRYCRRGRENLCIRQGYIAGGFSEYFIYPYQNLVKAPKGLDLVNATFTEAAACCVNGNNKLKDVPLGGAGVVIGTGPIGMIHLQLLKSRGLSTIAIDLKDNRLETSLENGWADHTIKANVAFEPEQDVIDEVLKLTGGFGADVVVTAAGLDPSVLEEGIQMAAKCGQVLYFAATLRDPVTLNLDGIHYRELDLVGSHDSTRADFEKAVHLMSSGAIDVTPIISHKYPLTDIYNAFDFANKREGLKVAVVNEGF